MQDSLNEDVFKQGSKTLEPLKKSNEPFLSDLDSNKATGEKPILRKKGARSKFKNQHTCGRKTKHIQNQPLLGNFMPTPLFVGEQTFPPAAFGSFFPATHGIHPHFPVFPHACDHSSRNPLHVVDFPNEMVPHETEVIFHPMLQSEVIEFPPHMLRMHCLPVYHHPKHGKVMVTQRDGTTFYHYAKSSETGIANAQTSDQINSFTAEQSDAVRHFSSCTGSDSGLARNAGRSEDLLIYSSHGSFLLTESSKSVSSSRCSSPFPASTNSSTATRDSALGSLESADDDSASLLGDCAKDRAYETLLQSILSEAEFALSDKGLTKNTYLLRQIKRSSQGFVNIKLVSSIKAIKKLTRDHKTVILALLRSTKLELNEERTKIKRKCPVLDQLPMCKDSEQLFVADLPANTSIEMVWSQLSTYGPITQLRLLKPGQPVPHYLHGYAATVPRITKMTCAVVEYERKECAYLAMQSLRKQNSRRNVVVLGHKLKRKLRDCGKFEEQCEQSSRTADDPNGLDLSSFNATCRDTSGSVNCSVCGLYMNKGPSIEYRVTNRIDINQDLQESAAGSQPGELRIESSELRKRADDACDDIGLQNSSNVDAKECNTKEQATT